MSARTTTRYEEVAVAPSDQRARVTSVYEEVAVVRSDHLARVTARYVEVAIMVTYPKAQGLVVEGG